MTAKRDTLQQYARDPGGFIDRFITHNEKGQPWQLSPHQRKVLALAFRWDAAGRLMLRVMLWSEAKKSGKTFLSACLVLWWAFTRSETEVILAANDLDQSVGRVFATIVKLFDHNPMLAKSATVRAEVITLTNNTVITAIPSDYKGAAGSRHSLAVLDELWGFELERAQRLYEELTPVPTEPDAWVLITTTAGFSGESELLERLYKQGLAGERLDDELEVYRADEMVMFWSHTPRQPWQTAEYYEQQRRHLRPSTFTRLHLNQWVSAESTFLTPELWDALLDPELRPLLPTREYQLYVGVDAATKSDTASVQAVFRRDGRLYRAVGRIWKPLPGQPLNLEETIETFLLQLHQQYDCRRILVDPFQMARSIATLKAVGLRIEEFPQTVGNTTRMGETLFDLVKGRNLVLFPDDELRQQALNTVAVEHARGWRIAKERASRKIDGVVALSIACVAAVEKAPEPPLEIWSGSDLVASTALVNREDIARREEDAFEGRSDRASEAIQQAIKRNRVAWPGEY